jgi:hypothetical protein
MSSDLSALKEKYPWVQSDPWNTVYSFPSTAGRYPGLLADDAKPELVVDQAVRDDGQLMALVMRNFFTVSDVDTDIEKERKERVVRDLKEMNSYDLPPSFDERNSIPTFQKVREIGCMAFRIILSIEFAGCSCVDQTRPDPNVAFLQHTTKKTVEETLATTVRWIKAGLKMDQYFTDHYEEIMTG